MITPEAWTPVIINKISIYIYIYILKTMKNESLSDLLFLNCHSISQDITRFSYIIMSTSCTCYYVNQVRWGAVHRVFYPKCFINNKSETRTHVCWESVSISMNVRRDWLLSLLSFRFTRFSAPSRAWEKTKRDFLFWNINPFLMIWNYANCSRLLRITRAIIIVTTITSVT